MLRYVLLRLAVAVVVLWLVVTASFFLMHAAPGGPFDRMERLPAAVQANVERQWGLDRPLGEQYLTSLGNMLRLDFGPSLEHMGRFRVRELLARGLPVSMELGAYAIVLALVLGVGAGVLGARRPGTWVDHTVMGLSLTGIAVPSIVLAPLLVVVFAVHLGWLPLGGWDSWSAKILPTLSLGLVYAASVARLTRTGLEEVLAQDFVRTARAKGLPEGAVLRRHALRGGLFPVLSWLGPALAGILTGSVVVERIFGIPGVAEHFVASAQARDYPMVLGVVVLYSGLLLLLNLLVDLVHALLDPRVSLARR